MQENIQLRKDGQATKIVQGLSRLIEHNNQNQTQTTTPPVDPASAQPSSNNNSLLICPA